MKSLPITAHKLRDIFRTQSSICDGAFFVRIVNSFKLLTIFGTNSILYVRIGSKYTSETGI